MTPTAAARADCPSPRQTGRYYGKYRGCVLHNVDPLNLGRIQARVPDVSGLSPTTWALPCVPIAGRQSGVFVVPAVGSGVWIEFEQGDPDHPIWVGGYWGAPTEPPVLALAALPGKPSVVIQTPGQNVVALSDLPGPTGGVLVGSARPDGARIVVNDLGIIIDNGKGASITLVGNVVAVNKTSLAVVG